MMDYLQGARYIAYFEGFQPTAKWDVNAWRLGFGSDTEGPDQIRVKPGMTTTWDRAIENLAIRIKHFEEIVISQVGDDIWESYPQPVKMALVDFAYNYGELEPTLCHLVKQRSLMVIAEQLYARGQDNGGVNHKRRAYEAGTVMAAI